MNKTRKEIQEIKANLKMKILSNIDLFKRSVIRNIDKEYRYFLSKNSDSAIINFAVNLQKRMLIPKGIQYQIASELLQSQNIISELWDNYFYDTTKNDYSLSANDYEKLQALYQIEFSDIEEEIKKKVLKEVQRSVRAGYGFSAIRKRLENSGLGFYTAENLATTALAQYDNAYHTEVAEQAGAKYYLYDGTRSENTRSFCSDHIGRVYTLAELKATDNKQGLPVHTSLGGYRCRHYLTALINYNRKTVGEKFNPTHFTKAA